MPRGCASPLDYRAVMLDSIHRFIEIKVLEYELMQTIFLNRLHKIKQLGFTYLIYPSAKHTRFEHSVGVMHLAGRMAERLAEKNPNLLLERRTSRAKSYLVELARLAGLLHDLGHVAYSHNLEAPLKSAIENPAEYSLDPAKVNYEYYIRAGKPHEVYTRMFLERLIRELENHECISGSISLLKAVLASLSGEEAHDELVDYDINPRALSIVAQLISHSVVDADRLDYLIRDAHSTGVLFGYVDIDRFIDSLRIEEHGDKLVLTIEPKGIPVVEDAYDARFKMYRSVYLHHKGVALVNALAKMLRYLFSSWDNATLESYRECLGGPEGLFDPYRLADCISGCRIQYVDYEFDVMILQASTRGDSLGRWAKALLHRRDLLPVSLVKRPESIISRITSEAKERGWTVTPETLVRAIRVRYSTIADEIRENVSRYLKARGAKDPEAEVMIEHIIREGEVELPRGFESLYLRNLIDSGRIPLIFVYAYDENEGSHRLIYRNADRLRQSVENIIVSSVLEELKR